MNGERPVVGPLPKLSMIAENPQTEAELARSIRDYVDAGLPEEKRKAERDMIQVANELSADGSVKSDGLGQKMGKIPGRVYMRWAQLLPGCWQDRQFVLEFLEDNPQCRAPGYRTKPSGIRNGVSFYQLNKHKVT